MKVMTSEVIAESHPRHDSPPRVPMRSYGDLHMYCPSLVQLMATPDEDTLRTQAMRTAGHLRIALPAIIAHTLIAPALPRFLEQHRALRVHLVIAEETSHADQCDAAICIRSVARHTQWYARLATMPDVVCASEEFLTVHGKPRDPRELNPAHCIGLWEEDQQPRAWSFFQGSTEVKLVPAAPLTFSDAQSAVATAVRGGGIILVPALAVEAQIAAGLLTPLLLDWVAPRRAVWMQHSGPLTPQLQAFADFVAGLLPSEPN
jgi:LysR family transcriptional regulator for bpeEF and oprC